jgi:hypothetical protein
MPFDRLDFTAVMTIEVITHFLGIYKIVIKLNKNALINTQVEPGNMLKWTLKISVLLCVLLSRTAFAIYGGYDYDVVGHVTRIDPSFTPSASSFPFRLDVEAGTCPTSVWLFYAGNGTTPQDALENRKLMYATLTCSDVQRRSGRSFWLQLRLCGDTNSAVSKITSFRNDLR